ncbi:GRP2 putative NADPH-dependent methylglyoxal reductase GRP2 [Candida maltosa Xu316]|uniref:NADPH-dependent methylglyoxal reductase, putative n=1 Tax=Candida maltosa (strain Xu316) TaxID=1245528 RepID=M3JDI0_CANMX|nr:NADPH-dependent methylglyoxal reductase, putative [Candida maltosa Xu316]
MSTTVIVSGATGFIAQHVVKSLLAKNYQVIGTVRSTTKGDHLLKLFNNPSNLSYEIVEDVGTQGAFDNVLKHHPEAKIFLHLASPFHFKATNIEKELLEPAVNGTKNVLQAIKDYGSGIQKVVITSSYAAIGTASREADKSVVVTEDDWNAITWNEALENPIAGYRGSKTFAEKAAWDFVKQNSADVKFTISTVNPTFVFGPQAFEVGQELNTSSEVINSILKGSVPPTKGGWIDVRDVAKAHIIAFEKEEAVGKRLLLNAGRFNAGLLVKIIKEKYPQIELPDVKEEVISLATIDDSKTRKILGFDYYSLEQSVYDSVKQIIDARK